MVDHNASSHKRRFPITLAAGFTVLAVSVCFFACSRTDRKSGGPPEKVTMAYATPPYTVLADIAQAKEYFRQKGLEVTPHFLSTGKAALDEVLQGKADFAAVAETPFMFAVMKGEKIAIIATIQASNRTNAIFARKDRGIRTPQDLKGKKIGLSSGTIGEFFTDTFLAVHGIPRKATTTVNLKPEEMPEALATGNVDAISTWSPFLNQARNRLGVRGITFYDEDIYTQTFNIVATQEYIHKNPGRIKKMLRALIEAEEFVLQNPEESQRIVADFRQMDRALLDTMWVGNTFSVSLEQTLVLALEDESRWAMQGRLTRAKKIPNYLDFIYLDGLLSVRPKTVRILR